MVGIILPREKLNRMVKRNESRENLQFYFQLADLHQVDILFYSLNRLDTEKLIVKGYIYSIEDQSFIGTTVEIPKINFFRIIIKKDSTYYKLKKIEKEYQIQFINLVPPRNKYLVYKHLKKDPNLTKHIPLTAKLSYKSLKRFLKKYQRVILKPNNGALGEGIYLIQKYRDYYHVNYTYKKKGYFKKIKWKQLYPFYLNYLLRREYIIQPWISFKKIDGNKFDIRTSVQKDIFGEWNMTGIVGRVAKKQGIVTNIAQGGYAISYTDLSKYLEKEAYEKLERLSIELALELENLYPSIVDLGLDIGIDTQNNLWFIETNFCDERYAYHLMGDEEMWFRSYKYPFEYSYSQYKLIQI